MPAPRPAFTLIELLVVITIIVVLLALLAPALDTAIYQAELTSCGAQQKTMAMAINDYAFEHKRHYPYRPGVYEQGWKPNFIHAGPIDLENDDRPTLQGYVQFNKMFNDPLAEDVDFEDFDVRSRVEVCYNLWFGYRYANHAGMMKVGDRFGWQGDRFNLLLSDRDVIIPGTIVHGSHPDDAGLTQNAVAQDEGTVPGSTETGVGIYVYSRWQNNTSLRGNIDMNFAATDGSVNRLTEVEREQPDGRPGDERLRGVPEFSDDRDPTGRTYVTRR